jgi:dsDNA-specific endonuclease/ATPase MutS2
MPESIKVLKTTVLKTLKENKENHVKEYNEAVEGWVEKAKQKVQNILDQLNSNKAKETKIEVHLPKPVSFEKEYTKAISMLEFEVRDEIEISKHDFDRFFLDEWEWKDNFLTNTTFYKNR